MFNKEDNYKKIYIDFMNINKIKDITSMGLEYLALAQYLYTVSNGIGLLLSTPHTIASDLNISERKAKTILNKLQDIDYIRYDSKEGIVWVVDMLKYTSIDPSQVESNRNLTRLFKRYLKDLSETSKIKIQIFEYYGEDYPFLFNKRVKEKSQTIKEVESISTFVDIYNIIVEGKGKKKGYLSKKVKTKIQELKYTYNAKPEIVRDYALNDAFFSQYDNISDLLDIILKDLLLAKLEVNHEQKESIQEESNDIPEDIFIDNKNKKEIEAPKTDIEREEELASSEDLAELSNYIKCAFGGVI